MIYFDFDSDGTLQIETSDAAEVETIVLSDNAVSGFYNDAMLVLSVLQLFVLLVIAFFTIVRRTNND